MRNKIQVNVRLDEPYVATLRKLGNQGIRIQQGLDLIQDPRFKQELTKNKEAYGPTRETSINEDSRTEAIRQEFTD